MEIANAIFYGGLFLFWPIVGLFIANEIRRK